MPGSNHDHTPPPASPTTNADLRFGMTMEVSSVSSKSLTLSDSKTVKDLFHKSSQEDEEEQKPCQHQLKVLELDEITLPPRPASESHFVLAFKNLSYSVKLRKKFMLPFSQPTQAVGISNTKVLLNDISGKAREGEIMAVLGASGSGKSTLIDALADRIERTSLKGSVTLSGEALSSKLLKAISAYVMQDDLLFPMLTVEETLMYAAEFRLPRSLSKAKKKERVLALIDQLGLTCAAKTMIGDESRRGVSGGERRRVSIGADIIHDPIILFLDEPTSGLDSTSAYMVVKVLQRIARSGSIVVVSVHQPSYRILELLDQTIFLSRGQTVYSGSPADLPVFLSEFGHPIPENENRTEFALDLIQEMELVPDGTTRMVKFHESWQEKNPSDDNKVHEIDKQLSLKEAISRSVSRGKLVSGAANDDSHNPVSSIPTFANPMWAEMLVISSRSMRNSRRIPELFTTRLSAIVVTGSILASIFWKLDDSERGIKERIGFMVFAMTTTFFTCAEAIPAFLQERYIFMRETAYNAYRRSSYVIAHTIITFPTLVLLSVVFSLITFPAVGLDGGFSGFLFFFLAILSAFWVGNSFVTFLSGIINHPMVAFATVIATLSYFLLFSGFFITRGRIPVGWIWFHYMSLVKYPYQAVMENEFQGESKCMVRGLQIFDNSKLAQAPDIVKEMILIRWSKTLQMNINASTCVMDGPGVLEQQGAMDINKWNCLLVSVGLGFFFRILFYFALMVGSKNKRS